MNLFNKVKQGMLDSTKAIKEISSDVTELTKVKIALSKDMSRIDELYYDLGKKMYTSYEENPNIELTEEVSSALLEIKATLERIKEYEAKIESLKGIMKCKQCGYEVSEGAKFCSNCGSKIEIQETLKKEDIEKNHADSVEEEKPE
ncbi:zinc ribbon domain-containing protein [Crassaminicella thermophila]|uniref:Zinc ribbon domain-containing protein n=1 Tax=Crassaminicella thermophila TaxID=2599308 RepID=A0A5C0SC25_CRATE|nr:zinc ribbon domain-containing protein [Crassaminicella thermophila]QEK11058.1 zinc ribbon domain-containing protein [Crassaminicella thermophila]